MWHDSSDLYEWHIGVIDAAIEISYFHHASHENIWWNLPEEEDIQETKVSQLLCKIKNSYTTDARLRIWFSASLEQVTDNSQNLKYFVDKLWALCNSWPILC